MQNGIKFIDLADADAAVNVSTAERTSRLLWHKHLQWIFVVASEHLSLENLKVLSVDVVLVLAPRWPTFLVLQAPVDREERSEHLELIAGHEHLVHLRVPRVPVADKALVMSWIVVRCNEERLVEKLLR